MQLELGTESTAQVQPLTARLSTRPTAGGDDDVHPYLPMQDLHQPEQLPTASRVSSVRSAPA
jgi:hypothetical protein